MAKKTQATTFVKKGIVGLALVALLIADVGIWSVAATLVSISPAHATGRGGSRNPVVIALTDDGRLIRFRARSPERTREIGFVSGLMSPDTSLIGIDFRVQDGNLYGVGNGGGIYTIDLDTAQASLVGSLTVALMGTFFGVDFNPAANALRVISDTGQNLRHPFAGPLAGQTQNDGTLTYTAPPAAPVPALGVTGAAYTNNDLNQPSTGTTLFDIDATLDQVVIQSPANNGILVLAGQLGVDADPSAVGFDIFSRLSGGVTVENRAFASLLVGGVSGFYGIDLLTGKATLLGEFNKSVVDIALPLSQ